MTSALRLTLTIGLILIGLSASSDSRQQLRAAREALGGEARITAIKSLVLRGQWQQLDVGSGRLLEPRPFEIRLLLPDHYLRLASMVFMQTRAGFARDHLIYEWKPLNPQMKMSMQVPADELKTQHANFARLMLGLFAETKTAMQLEMQAGNAAKTLEFKGPENFAAALDFDETSHVPVRVRYPGERSFPAKPQAAQSAAATTGAMPPPERAEIVLTFDDRRNVDGLSIAHHITESARGITFQDIRFESVVVNPSLTPREFEFDEGSPR